MFGLSPQPQEIVLRGQLYSADCKDEGNTLNPHLPKKKISRVIINGLKDEK